MSIFDLPKSLLNAVEAVLLKEHEMSRGEVAAVDKKYSDEIAAHRSKTSKISGHVFPEGVDRIVLPLINTSHQTKTDVETHLHSNGFHSVDYASGTAKDSYNRSVSIGKALNKTGAEKELVDRFATHQKTYAKQPETSNLQVVISRHPHDVIGMSQGTQWGLRPDEEHSTKEKHIQSCMRFDTTHHDKYMPSELTSGTHVAWLTKVGDNEAKEPISRITLRPYSEAVQQKDVSPESSIGTFARFPVDTFKKMHPSDEKDSAEAIEHVADITARKNVTYSHTFNGHHYYKLGNTLKSSEYVDSENDALNGSSSNIDLVNLSPSEESVRMKTHHFGIPTDAPIFKTIADAHDISDPHSEEAHKIVAEHIRKHINNAQHDQHINPYNVKVARVEFIKDESNHLHFLLHTKQDEHAKYIHTKQFIKNAAKEMGLSSRHGKVDADPRSYHRYDNSSLTQYPPNKEDTLNARTVLVPGSKTYGETSDAFSTTVTTWAKKHFPFVRGKKYHAAHGIYLDGDAGEIQK